MSDADCELGSTCGDGVARCTLITGDSKSFLRADEAAVGLPKEGGGDFNRGEMGHRGASLEVSWTTDANFCGTGARRTASVPDGGGKLGIVVAESCRGVTEEVGMFDFALDGLRSWPLFLRDCAGDMDARLGLPEVLVVRVGDVSLDSTGEAVRDVEAEVHLEAWVSGIALDGTDGSLSAEFRLEVLASRPVVWLAFAIVSEPISAALFGARFWLLVGGSCEKWDHVFKVAYTTHPGIGSNSNKWPVCLCQERPS
ncbi:hypothetical protein F4825DRAFT_116722 [Nemania diffusa]|nr:hypothetical protein F4825DRAFT_116722 [Nemania diffusa]